MCVVCVYVLDVGMVCCFGVEKIVYALFLCLCARFLFSWCVVCFIVILFSDCCRHVYVVSGYVIWQECGVGLMCKKLFSFCFYTRDGWSSCLWLSGMWGLLVAGLFAVYGQVVF